jgi:ABC-2 type transport system ATP-binding protein
LSSDVMIEADALTKRYGSLRALDKVSFEVHRGEVVGFLGPNGAGKSTTMRILTCFISASGGTAKVHGFDVFDDPLEVRRRVGYLPQRAPLYGDMNVWEYLAFVADMRGLPHSTFKRRMRGIVEVCGLAQVLGKDIRDLSHGYRQRVGLGQALVHDPPILVLDEPTADLDPNEKAEVIRYIKEIGKDRTILLSTHNLAEVETACARAIIVSKGRVVADGPLDEIRGRSQKVRYIVTVDEQSTLEGGAEGYRTGARKAPSAQEVQAALAAIPKVGNVTELPTDEKAHRFQLGSSSTADLRPELFKLMVQKGWMLLELRRDAQSLEDVFKALTKGDERKDRGRRIVDEEDDEEDDDASAASASAAKGAAATKGAAAKDEEEEDEDDDEEDDEGDDAEGDDADAEGEEEDEAPAKKVEAPAKTASKPAKKKG